MEKQSIRPISVIGEEIRKDWKNINYGAVPYLDVMATLNGIDDSYMQDSARSIVRYFLGNASTWKGETARRIKGELNNLLTTHTLK